MFALRRNVFSVTFQLPPGAGSEGRGLSPGIIETDIFHCRQKATKIAKVNFQFSSHRIEVKKGSKRLRWTKALH